MNLAELFGGVFKSTQMCVPNPTEMWVAIAAACAAILICAVFLWDKVLPTKKAA